MKRDLFRSMREQMTPSDDAKAALEERLARPIAAKPHPWRKYAVLAACVALFVTAVPVYTALNPPLHAYAVGTVEEVTGLLGDKTGGATDLVSDRGSGIDGTQPLTPGGADIVERPVQEEAAAAYAALMAQFATDYEPGCYPDWYGGAYIDQWGELIVCVADAPLEDKSLYLEIQAMCGGHSVGFQNVTYPLAHLNSLQEQVVELMRKLDFADQLWASGVYEEHNQVAVTLPFASKKALAGLHQLDPAGDAIAVTVVERTAVEFEWKVGQPTEAQPGGDVDGNPDGYSGPGETYNTLPVPISELPAVKEAPVLEKGE